MGNCQIRFELLHFICGEILDYLTRNVSNTCFINSSTSLSSLFASTNMESALLLMAGYALYQALITPQADLQELFLDPSKFTPTKLADPIKPNPHETYLEKIKYKGEVPKDFLCPIGLTVMYDPVRISGSTMSELHVFERRHLETWLAVIRVDENGKPLPKTNPLTNLALPSDFTLIPADDIKKKIDKWLQDLLLLRSAFLLWSRPRTDRTHCVQDSEKPEEKPTI